MSFYSQTPSQIQYKKGFSDLIPADERVQTMVNKFRDEIIKKSADRRYPYLRALSYRVRDNTDYVIKVDAGIDYIHVNIYELKKNKNSFELRGIDLNKRYHDELSLDILDTDKYYF